MDKRAIEKEKQRARYYRSSKAIILKALNSYTKQFIEEIKKCTTPAQMKAVADRPIRSEAIEKALKNIYATVGKQFGEQTIRQLVPDQKAINFGRTNPITTDYWFAWTEKLLKGKLGQRIEWITGTTKDVFISVVDRIAYAGFESGKGIPEIAREMMKDLNISQRYRAERIARTEVIGASNMSSQAGAEATGLDLEKEWISFIDSATRESHVALNGEKVAMDEPFSNGLDVPGDAGGEAEEVINCRCTVGYGVKDSEYNWGRNI
jgi:SPP1 gp7 family putative phage head morphogenesis protein